MNLDSYKELDDLLLDETNVKILCRDFGIRDENGNKILVNYIRENRKYFWNIDGKDVNEISDNIIIKLLEKK